MNTQKVQFIRSAASKKDFIRDGHPTVVFSGRSNVGKSSLINSLLNRKNYARVGATPGKTAHINYFNVDGVYFVDLPGYGFARVSDNERRRWGQLMEDYFASPELISLGVLIVDSRHAPTSDDVTMNDYFVSTGRPYVIIANKFDKLKKSEQKKNLQIIRNVLSVTDATPLIPYSCINGTGRKDLLGIIEKMV